jgi:phosphoserine phosphatase
VATSQLTDPIKAIIFDCDGTITSIEGIDELARQTGVSSEVETLTAEAMGVTGISADLYQRRLDLVRPSKAQVQALAPIYFSHVAPDLIPVLAILQRLGKEIYVVSAGLLLAVRAFGEMLQIPARHIFAVAVTFDEQGNFLDFDHQSLLINNTGKREVITQIQQQHSACVFVGDGLNDFAARDLVTRFVGYGGAFFHEKIAQGSEFYIKEASMAPLLALVLTAEEVETLTQDERDLYQSGEGRFLLGGLHPSD